MRISSNTHQSSYKENENNRDSFDIDFSSSNPGIEKSERK